MGRLSVHLGTVPTVLMLQRGFRQELDLSGGGFEHKNENLLAFNKIILWNFFEFQLWWQRSQESGRRSLSAVLDDGEEDCH